MEEREACIYLEEAGGGGVSERVVEFLQRGCALSL